MDDIEEETIAEGQLLQKVLSGLYQLQDTHEDFNDYILGGLETTESLEEVFKSLVGGVKKDDQDIYKFQFDIDQVEEELHYHNKLIMALQMCGTLQNL